MEKIVITEIRIEPKPGANLSECLKEAIKLSTHEWTIVKLIFNQKEYPIDPYAFYLQVRDPL